MARTSKHTPKGAPEVAGNDADLVGTEAKAGRSSRRDAAGKSDDDRKREPRRRRKYELSEAEPSRCPKCSSTLRAQYFRRYEFPCSKTPAGQPCTHVVSRYTQCLNPTCKQHRIDRSFENRVAASNRAA